MICTEVVKSKMQNASHKLSGETTTDFFQAGVLPRPLSIATRVC